MTRKLLLSIVVSAAAMVNLSVNSKFKNNSAGTHFFLVRSTLCESVQSKRTHSKNDNAMLINKTILIDKRGEILTMPDGSKYRGELSDGQRSNHGESWDTKSHYVGSWANNVKHGYGLMKYHNGFVYEGEFSDDVPNGQGKLILRNGEVLEGVFVNGELQGHEKIPEFGWSKVSLNGRIVEGDFTFLADQSILKGHGRVSTYVLEYDGEIVNDLPEGKGIMSRYVYSIEGRRIEKQIVQGTFTKGRITILQRTTVISTHGTTVGHYYPDGRQYVRVVRSDNTQIIEGEARDGKFIGIVTITYPNGTVVKGTMYYYNKLYGKCLITDSYGNTEVVHIHMPIVMRVRKWWEERK